MRESFWAKLRGGGGEVHRRQIEVGAFICLWICQKKEMTFYFQWHHTTRCSTYFAVRYLYTLLHYIVVCKILRRRMRYPTAALQLFTFEGCCVLNWQNVERFFLFQTNTFCLTREREQDWCFKNSLSLSLFYSIRFANSLFHFYNHFSLTLQGPREENF